MQGRFKREGSATGDAGLSGPPGRGSSPDRVHAVQADEMPSPAADGGARTPAVPPAATGDR
ncbi:hypothetical protein, partial [Streptomyces sp. YIM 98790]|uniref:hypothetical protein n=1 Tax=Streptomyces sp. YIM 98790 TaxID=2689077 RepID=UPI001A9E4EFB